VPQDKLPWDWTS